jgi:hypothetical protein
MVGHSAHSRGRLCHTSMGQALVTTSAKAQLRAITFVDINAHAFTGAWLKAMRLIPLTTPTIQHQDCWGPRIENRDEWGTPADSNF